MWQGGPVFVKEASCLFSMAMVEMDAPSDPNDIWYILTAAAEAKSVTELQHVCLC